MIKTVAFAPPRPQSSRPAPKKAVSKRASGSSSSSASAPAPFAPTQPSLFSSPSEPTPVVAIPAAQLRAEAAKKEAEKTAPTSIEAPRKPKIKRAKPGEISAEAYGAKVSKRVELGQTEVPAEDAPKKRLTKAEREARKQLMRPDEGLLQRLQRASALTPAKKEAKPKGWRFDCGRCGKTLFFQTSGALCECGAIAVRE